MSRIIDSSYKQNYFKVRLTYKDVSLASPYWGYKEYTNWTQTLSGASSDGFESVPSMEVKLPSNNGILDDKEIKITLPLDSFLTGISSEEPVTRIKIDVWEVSIDPIGTKDALSLYVFRGYLTKTVRNPQGKRGIVTLIGKSPKHMLDIKLGLKATPECIWSLGEGKCGASATLQSGFTVSSISGKVLTVSTDPTYTEDYYYHRGYILRNELRIGIREWRSSSPRVFYMVETPPSDWVGQGVYIMPGCDKTIETCKRRWNSESTFMGIGYGIPAYQPDRKAR